MYRKDFLSLRDEEFMDECFKRVQTWLRNKETEEIALRFETHNFPMKYLLQKELRNGFKTIWTESSGKLVVRFFL